MKFRELNIGDTFDWISPDHMLNSFFERCVKTSVRTYQTIEQHKMRATAAMRVGTIDAEVFHVKQK